MKSSVMKNPSPMIGPANFMKFGQSRPNSNDRTVPETAPTANRIAAPFAHAGVAALLVGGRITGRVEPRLLIADDEPALVRALRRQLQQEGFDVAEANDVAGLRAELGREPEIVLLDLRLGDASGLDLIVELRDRLVEQAFVRHHLAGQCHAHHRAAVGIEAQRADDLQPGRGRARHRFRIRRCADQRRRRSVALSTDHTWGGTTRPLHSCAHHPDPVLSRWSREGSPGKRERFSVFGHTPESPAGGKRVKA